MELEKKRNLGLVMDIIRTRMESNVTYLISSILVIEGAGNVFVWVSIVVVMIRNCMKRNARMIVMGVRANLNAREKESSLSSEMEAEKEERRRERRDGRIGKAGVERLNTEHIENLIAITITILLHINLLMRNFADTQAVAPFLHNADIGATLGGPAPGVAGTPRQRGPLPPPTRGRGRLPTWWASPLTGAGPKLPWQDARAQYMHLLHTARWVGPAAAMASRGMAQLDEHDGNLKGKFYGSIPLVPTSFPAPPPPAASWEYLDMNTNFFASRVGNNPDTGSFTTIHTRLHFHTIIYTTMVVLI